MTRLWFFHIGYLRYFHLALLLLTLCDHGSSASGGESSFAPYQPVVKSYSSGFGSVGDYYPLNIGDEHRFADGSSYRIIGTRNLHGYVAYVLLFSDGQKWYYSYDAAGTLRCHGAYDPYEKIEVVLDSPIEMGYADMHIPVRITKSAWHNRLWMSRNG